MAPWSQQLQPTKDLEGAQTCAKVPGQDPVQWPDMGYTASQSLQPSYQCPETRPCHVTGSWSWQFPGGLRAPGWRLGVASSSARPAGYLEEQHCRGKTVRHVCCEMSAGLGHQSDHSSYPAECAWWLPAWGGRHSFPDGLPRQTWLWVQYAISQSLCIHQSGMLYPGTCLQGVCSSSQQDCYGRARTELWNCMLADAKSISRDALTISNADCSKWPRVACGQ